MDVLPVRLKPGDDLRRAFEDLARGQGGTSAFVLSGIGSLGDARLRYAGEAEETVLAGPLEITSIAGSISPDGAHLHMTVSDRHGKVSGGHVGYGNIVRTTVEAVLLLLPAWSLTRQHDAATGHKELHIGVRPPAGTDF